MAKPKIKLSKASEIKIEKFLGINDVDPPQKCKPGELQLAINCEVDDVGRIRRRDGFSSVFAGTPHSLWSDGMICLFREGTNLRSLNTLWSPTTIRTGILGTNRMNYFTLNGRVYYSDEIITGIYDGTTDRTWGLELPPTPVLSATSGNLQEGNYHCLFTFVRDDGQESGTSPSSSIDVGANGGITVTLPTSPDPTVEYVYVYLTTCNGETFYLAKILANGTASVTYAGDTSEFSLKCPTMHLSPAPAGHLIQFYRGRIYVAADNILWYSIPFGYELFDIANNHIQLDSRITILTPVHDGIWVGTQTKVAFLSGQDGPQLQYIEKLNCGASEGTQQKIQDTNKEGQDLWAWIFATDDGVVIGTDGGLFKNLTETKYDNPTAIKGTSLLREENDRSIFIVSLI